MTLRLRLTLLYGACFIAAAAGLLAITYALFTGGSRATAVQITAGHFKVVTASSAGSAGSAGPLPAGGQSGGASAGASNSGSGSTGTSADGRFRRQRAPSPGSLSALTQRANSVLAAQRTGDRSLLLEESGIALGIVSMIANASHELRTPLTFERTLVEVALADPDASVDSLRRACERVVTSTEQQERLIDALLTLARSQGEIGRPRSAATRR